jgi:hypothetical protein
MNIKHNTLSALLVLLVIFFIGITIYPGVFLPTVYLSVAALMVLIAVMMFAAGYFFGTEKATHIHSETTTTTSHTPDRINDSGRYEEGRHVEETRTQKTSRSNDDNEKEEHSTETTTTTSGPNRSGDSSKRIEKTLTHKTSRNEES